MQASLLKRLRPTDFQSFAAFVAWRSDIVQLLLSVLSLAARHVSRRNSRLASSCRTLMARLKVSCLLCSLSPEAYIAQFAGCHDCERQSDLALGLQGGLRRVDVRIAEEFDEAEYAEATETVFKAAAGLASQST